MQKKIIDPLIINTIIIIIIHNQLYTISCKKNDTLTHTQKISHHITVN